MIKLRFLERYRSKAVIEWYKDYKMGLKSYILYKGVINIGFPIFIATMLMPYIVGFKGPNFTIYNLLAWFVVWSVAGAVMGWSKWKSNIKNYGSDSSAT